MTIIFVDPDESANLAQLDPKTCEGLEALTGADFILSTKAINPVRNIKWHLDNNSLFVNLKRGYDLVINHDQSKKFAARIQQLGVAPGRAILLGVGNYRDDRGKLSIAGYNEPPSAIAYETFIQSQVNALGRGLVWMTIPSQQHLATWINSWDKRPAEPITVLSRTSYNWQGDDFWQPVEEPPTDSVESILACGLPGFGPKRALATVQFLRDYPLPVTLFNALMVLSACDDKGKRVFKVPEVGDKGYKEIRRVLYGPRPYDTTNLFDNHGDRIDFALAALDQFHALFQEKLATGISARDAYNQAMSIAQINLHELVAF